ncbi:hypothetical protein RDWZM_003888 [Blomia tropicalis]|uniref:E3 SUMO-protein ligase NSE2 n=1 Tax=Blomia tropicalis TaxID=40697 RepID=A0A9Q0MHQ6_BLOTA|nr:hypothetical protein RDWZM_003888 [Blomia tropicalis]
MSPRFSSQLNLSQTSDVIKTPHDQKIEDILRNKESLLKFTKLLKDNREKFGTAFTSSQKERLFDNMTIFCKREAEYNLEKKAIQSVKSEVVSSIEDSTIREQAIEMGIAKYIEQIPYQAIFCQYLENLKSNQTEFDLNNDQSYTTLTQILDMTTEDQDAKIDLMEESTQFQIPIDPFMKIPISIPVRNMKCKHVYDKEQFFKIFESRPRNSMIKCPVSGCVNKKVSIEDVEEDVELRSKIEKFKQENDSTEDC